MTTHGKTPARGIGEAEQNDALYEKVIEMVGGFINMRKISAQFGGGYRYEWDLPLREGPNDNMDPLVLTLKDDRGDRVLIIHVFPDFTTKAIWSKDVIPTAVADTLMR